MDKPVIAITGANGFIGSSLLQYFYDQNYPVIALARTLSVKLAVEVRSFNLEQPLQSDLLQGVDILIHFAFIKVDVHANA